MIIMLIIAWLVGTVVAHHTVVACNFRSNEPEDRVWAIGISALWWLWLVCLIAIAVLALVALLVRKHD
jgi:uncharacterized DUF497 family protein